MIFNRPIQTLAAWRKDEQERANSSSGGIAAVITEHWIKNGGVVYGAAFVAPFSIMHVRCTTQEEAKKLRGSKYVQSSMVGVVKSIEKDLSLNLAVLFFGTPCQVSIIKKRFGDAVVVIDLICHGTPSIETLKESIPNDIKKKEFDNICFRYNGNYGITLLKQDEVIWNKDLSLYIKGFYSSLFNRECCYSCRYAKTERLGDITLGDFWGIDETAVNTNIAEGISLVLLNTLKGKELLDNINNDIYIVERTLSEAVAGNAPLRGHCSKSLRAKIYTALYPKLGFKWATILSIPDVVIKNILFK